MISVLIALIAVLMGSVPPGYSVTIFPETGTAVDFNVQGQIVGYTFVKWEDPDAGWAYPENFYLQSMSRALAINDADVIVGYSGTDAAPTAVMERDGLTYAIGPGPGSSRSGGSEAVSINDRGQIVGALLQPDFRSTPFLWQSGSLRVLPSFGDCAPSRINDVREIAGTCSAHDAAHSYAVYWDTNGAIHRLPGLVPGSPSWALSLNNYGDIVGEAAGTDGIVHPVLWQDGRIAQLPDHLAGAHPLEAVDINDWGEIIGDYLVDPGYGPDFAIYHGVLWQKGQEYDLAPLISNPAPQASYVTRIDDFGRILCSCPTPAILTPVLPRVLPAFLRGHVRSAS